jgi:hypothetical protein
MGDGGDNLHIWAQGWNAAQTAAPQRIESAKRFAQPNKLHAVP